MLVTVMTARPAFAQAAAPDPRPLVFVGDRDYPPLSYLENGVAKGFDVDVARALARPLGRAVRIELMDWAEAQRRVLRGEADGLTDLADTPDRRTLYEFADATIRHDFGLFVGEGRSSVHGIDDLSDRSVGVTQGGFPREFLQRMPSAHLITIANYPDGFARLAAGPARRRRRGPLGRGLLARAAASRRRRHRRPAVCLARGQHRRQEGQHRARHRDQPGGAGAESRRDARPDPGHVAAQGDDVRLPRTDADAGAVDRGRGDRSVIAAGMAIWVWLLRRQIRVRRDAEAELFATNVRLRASEEKFAKAFEASPDFIAIVDFGPDGIIEVNSSFERITGYSRGEVLGRTVADLGVVLDAPPRESMLETIRERGSFRTSSTGPAQERRDRDAADVGATDRGRRPPLLPHREPGDHRAEAVRAAPAPGGRATKLLVSEIDLEALSVAAIESVHQIMDLDYVSLALREPGSPLLNPAAQRGVLDAGRSAAAVPLVRGHPRTRRSRWCFTSRIWKRRPSRRCIPGRRDPVGLRPAAGDAPGTLGALNVGSRNPGAFSHDDITLLQQLSTYVAIAIQNARAYEEIKTLKDQLSEEKLYLEEEIRVDHNFADDHRRAARRSSGCCSRSRRSRRPTPRC